MIPISVTILVKNSEKYLEQVLKALQQFDEVLLYDNGSNDRTIEIGAGFPNVRIVYGEFKGFGPTHNEASKAAKHDWILSIDSDEIVTEEMKSEIQTLHLNRLNVYSFPRKNFYRGKWIKWCGWHPDRQFRLYHKHSASFTNQQVHEAIDLSQSRPIDLQGSIIHYSYSSLSEFLKKMESYSTLFALQNRGLKSSSPFKALSHAIFAFLKSYLLKRGFLGGYEGFLISVYNSHTALYKYLKLYEANQNDILKTK